MTAVVVFLTLLIVVTVSLVIAAIAASITQQAEAARKEAAERARVERTVAEASWQIHQVTSDAIATMLDEARKADQP